ncbi:hypothetical protein V8C40DRAFT_284583 [Trichoderma camerunense]
MLTVNDRNRKLNRPLKATTALGTPYETVRQQEYDRPGDGTRRRLVVTDANGVKTRYILDGLGRLCEVEKQDRGDFSEKNVDVFRMVQKRNYNAQSQCIEMAEIDWLRTDNGGPIAPTHHAHPHASVPLSASKYHPNYAPQPYLPSQYPQQTAFYRTTDNTGVVSISETDPISLTKTEGTEGQGLIKTHRNTLGLVTKVGLIQKNGQQYSQVEYFYDGIGRLREQKEALGRLTKFECDGFDRATRTTWPDPREATTLHSTQTASV